MALVLLPPLPCWWFPWCFRLLYADHQCDPRKRQQQHGPDNWCCGVLVCRSPRLPQGVSSSARREGGGVTAVAAAVPPLVAVSPVFETATRRSPGLFQGVSSSAGHNTPNSHCTCKLPYTPPTMVAFMHTAWIAKANKHYDHSQCLW